MGWTQWTQNLRFLRGFLKLNFFTDFLRQAPLVNFRFFCDSDLKAVPSALLCRLGSRILQPKSLKALSKVLRVKINVYFGHDCFGTTTTTQLLVCQFSWIQRLGGSILL